MVKQSLFQHYPSKNYPNAASTWNIVAAISSQSMMMMIWRWLIIQTFSQIWIVFSLSFPDWIFSVFLTGFLCVLQTCRHLLRLFHCFVPAKLQDLRQFEFGSNFACYPPFPPRNILFAGSQRSPKNSCRQFFFRKFLIETDEIFLPYH